VQRFELQRVFEPFLYKSLSNFPIELFEYDCVESTNKLLIDMARAGSPVGTVVWAHSQEGGRGRLGRSFVSPEGGIYISFLVPCPKSLEDVGFSLTAKAGVAVKRTIEAVCNKKCGIKWVNDIIIDGKKVCGILAQLVDKSKVVLGIGINYSTPKECFGDEIRNIAGSIYEIEDTSKNRSLVIPPMQDFVLALIGNVFGLLCGEELHENEKNWLAEYKNSSTILGNKVKVMQAGCVVGEGIATYIDDNCHLHVLNEDGTESVLSTGEVSVRT